MLENLTPPEPKSKNRMTEILESLDSKDREILLNALDDKSWSSPALAKALTERGIKVSNTVIQRYRAANDLAR